ncbi:Hsp33 family molecular chaperone HslO [Sphingomonas sp. ID0503]|uniref:Hsp33 family molecular chaperone HslO n=1 Tax=Sphingomonas sp. ID0503 TaxID=3399691 RepID=UPI003AFAA2E6
MASIPENTPWTLGDVDHVVGFTIPARHARGRAVRLGPVLDAILSNHGYPPVIERILAEALTITALLGSTLKHEEGQLTLQAQTEGGAIDLLVCDYRGGEMRGYVRHDPDRLAEMPVEPSLFALFGKGYLAITFDQAVSGERYQGIVPLEGASLAQAVEVYFAQSEQIPSLLRVAVTAGGPEGRIAGGFMLQHLPEGEEGRERLHTRLDHPEWEAVKALAVTVQDAELIDPTLTIEALLWRLFNEEEVRVLPGSGQLRRGCRCSAAYYSQVLARFPEDERAQMVDEDGLIRVDCAFCARQIVVHPAR